MKLSKAWVCLIVCLSLSSRSRASPVRLVESEAPSKHKGISYSEIVQTIYASAISNGSKKKRNDQWNPAAVNPCSNWK